MKNLLILFAILVCSISTGFSQIVIIVPDHQTKQYFDSDADKILVKASGFNIKKLTASMTSKTETFYTTKLKLKKGDLPGAFIHLFCVIGDTSTNYILTVNFNFEQNFYFRKLIILDGDLEIASLRPFYTDSKYQLGGGHEWVNLSYYTLPSSFFKHLNKKLIFHFEARQSEPVNMILRPKKELKQIKQFHNYMNVWAKRAISLLDYK